MRYRMLRPTLKTSLGLVVTFTYGCVPSPRFSGRAFQEKFMPPETAEASLPNGVHVFLEQDPQSPVVSIGWMVPAGRTSDPPGKAGLAHLTEHLVFEAPRRGGTSALEFYDRSGVQFQGETDSAATRFYVTVHRERFAELLKFEKERMSDPLTSLGQANVRREIRILHEEAAALHPHWQQNAMNSLFRAMFPQGSPLVVDSEDESLNTLTIEDARQFVAAHYRPSSMQLFIVGDFNWQEAQANLGPIKRLSSRTTTGAPKLASTESPPSARPAAKIIQHQGFVADNVLRIGWPLPPHLDMVGIEPMLVPLVTSVLPRIEGPSQGKYPAWMPQGSLGQKSADLITTPQGSALVVTAQLPPKAEPAKIATKIISEVDSLANKIAQNPTTFALVQLKVTQSSLRETENVVYRVSRLMTQHSLGDTRLSREYFSDINAVTAQQAADFSRTWLRKAMARVVLVSPVQVKESDTLTVTVPKSQSTFTNVPAEAMGASPKALFPDGRFVWKKLSNGVEVAVLSRPKTTINTLLLGVRSTSRNPELEPIDAFVDIARNTLPCPTSAMACKAGVDAASFRSIVSSLADSTPEAARYLLAVAAAPRYDWNPGVKDWFGPLLEKHQAMPDALAGHELQAALWGNHPRGKPLSNDLLRRMTLTDLLQWENANIRPENAMVIAVTNKDPDRLADTIAANMQRWIVRRRPPQMPASTAPALDQPHPLQILSAADPGLESARFYFGCLMPPLKTFTERAAAKMVGDWVYRVLFAQFRNQSDASYFTATRVNAYSSGTTSMQGILDVSMDELESAIALFRDLFDRPRAFDHREIALMKELRWRRVALQNLTGPEIAAEIFDRWSFHMGNPTPLDELKEIRSVGSAELDAIWNVCRQNAVLQVRANRPLRIRFDN